MGEKADSHQESNRETKQQAVNVKQFWISSTEITNGQYRIFNNHHNSGQYRNKSLNSPNQPVVNVIWYDAIDYAEWLSKKTRK